MQPTSWSSSIRVKRTQGVQDDIIAMLDELIKQAEDSPP